MEKMTPEALSLHQAPHAFAALPFVGRPMTTRDRHAILERTVQLHVIPHLLGRPAKRMAPFDMAAIAYLADLSLQAGAGAVVDHVIGLLDHGADAEAILLDLLAPAARLLGQHWVDDVCTFADVTIGTGHLQAAMRAVRPIFLRDAQPAAAAPRALLMPQSGEQHDFGVRMLSAFFARAGWDVWPGGPGRTGAVDVVGRDWIDLVGISVSHDAMLDTTRRTVAALRAASRNPAVVILVGGLPFTLDASLAQAVGADGTAADGAGAVRLAATLLPPCGVARGRPPDWNRSP